MKSRTSRFYAGALQHTYKITKDFGILFYRLEDRLMMFTIRSMTARKHKMKVVCASYMYTHIHEVLLPVDKRQMDAYERDCDRLFVSSYNTDTGRTGPLFKREYGFSSKVSVKEQRTCIIYVLNNHPEKKLCRYAIDSRWNFLAYSNSAHPFSDPLNRHSASYYLREAIKTVDMEFEAARYLKSQMIRSMLKKLSRPAEREQLVDYIISRYMYCDFEYAVRLFGSYDNLVLATQSMTGSEYDVGETYDKYSDVPYEEMTALAERDGLLGCGMKVLHLQETERMHYANRYRRLTSAAEKHIRAFFFRDSALEK